MEKYTKVIINLFDGEGAGTADGNGEGAGNGSGATTGTQETEIKQETKAKAQRLGLSDDLLESYQNAYGYKEGEEPAAESTERQQAENLDEEFESLIKGKYKDQFGKKMNTSFSERFSKAKNQIDTLKNQVSTDNEILSIIANKYNIDSNDTNALLEAVKGDSSYFSEKALGSGMTAEELQDKYFSDKEVNETKEELNRLRQEKAMAELDTRLQNMALKTRETYHDFNLQEEMNNPAFTAALDFIAKRNTEKNKSTGKNDEVFDTTFAYEMAHADELRQQMVNRTAKAAMNAATKHMQANANRISENVNQRSSRAVAKSVKDMSDSEFDTLVENIKNGTAHIPR